MMKLPSTRTQAGISMVDVMVAIFIFSVGLLGIAGLQTMAKQSNYEAVQRTTAVMLANDILERMRSNPNQVAAYYRTLEPVGDNGETNPTCTGDAVAGVSDPCSPAELAAHDVWEWEQAIIGATDTRPNGANDINTGGLVQPSACITAGAGANDVTIAIVWRGQTPTSNPTSTTCGESTNNYGANNEFRQVFLLNATINPVI